MTAYSWTPGVYPTARRADTFESFKSEKHGEVKVHDPYRWLESSSEETEKWINNQVEFTSKFLDQIPNKDQLVSKLMKNMNFAKFSAPSLKKDGRWYWYYNSGLQAQSVIYRSKTSDLPNFAIPNQPETEVGEVFFDPNLLSSDGTASITVSKFSPQGKYFAYGISLSGSDFFTIWIRPTSNPLDTPVDNILENDPGRLPDVLRYAKFTDIVWTHEDQGFFYQRFPSREEHGSFTDDKAGTETTQDLDAKLYYHKIGTPQSEDILIAEDPNNPEYMFDMEVSEVDGKYLILSIRRDTSRKNTLWIADKTVNELGSNIKWFKVIDTFDAGYYYLANDDTKFYLRTNKDAAQYRVVEFDLTDPTYTMRDVIPEDKGAHLEQVLPFDNDKFAVVYKRNVKDELYIYSMAGKQLERLAVDFVGTIDVSAKREQAWLFATLSGFTTPGTYTVMILLRRTNGLYSEIPRWKVSNYKTLSVWYSSKDGTRVPMFIVRHKDTPIDGTAPIFQYGYGGFAISIGPAFSSANLTAIESYGFIYALPNIRGGSEFVEQNYGARGRIVINGASNGGLLVAACANRAPEGLYGAAVAEVGVLDMLKVGHGHQIMATLKIPMTLILFIPTPHSTTFRQAEPTHRH
ncbi:hypothetical protein Clacol_010573 [Clathrus columnatus]|uniref:Prolyl endopeptidase n=1 Tax=Clathrus columnatus TaxID=1419009 RepID=A0AAV5ANM6_9AGAM|nr:hypothetical protein Clacol_010573 [Clathrus columnatus]